MGESRGVASGQQSCWAQALSHPRDDRRASRWFQAPTLKPLQKTESSQRRTQTLQDKIFPPHYTLSCFLTKRICDHRKERDGCFAPRWRYSLLHDEREPRQYMFLINTVPSTVPSCLLLTLLCAILPTILSRKHLTISTPTHIDTTHCLKYLSIRWPLPWHWCSLRVEWYLFTAVFPESSVV